ncbi:pectinesterase-like [Vigna unguiculata]|uniref:Pectinesterase n=1 Tax=Vigna unguiculata TaxID=3917 RepID=A0A4D6N029_VIGUN|nr:pectinesterase-like [Vigna unguiculata]QCE07150.1 pectinesterase [Vigna unguiculata]
MANGKVLVSGVSLILVVGVAIGVVVVVNKSDSSDPKIAAQQKNVKAMCEGTEETKLCHETLSSVDGNTSDPKVYIAAGVEATMKRVIKALNMSDRLKVEHGDKDPGIKMALDDCKDLIEFALDSIESSVNLVRDQNIQAMYDQTPDFRNWLSAIISYQETCMDGLNNGTNGEKEIKEKLNTDSLDEMGKLTGIVLDIVTNLSNILERFDLKLNLSPASRRLLQVDHEGLPTWFSGADRKLLAALDKGQAGAPNAVVAKDGSGKFKTVKEAIDSYPKGHQGRFVIYVKAGIYDEYILIPKKSTNILIYGDGPAKTIITGHKNFVDGVKTMQTATFANTAPGFIAKSMTFENTAGAAKHQAVAFRNQGDMSAMFDCSFHGYQDTLYVHANRQFYRNCEISGTIDFIFGASATVIQNSRIVARLPLSNQFNTVTADGTKLKNMATGIVIQNCEIVPEKALYPSRLTVKSYLGRPWKQFARTIVMESNIGDVIHPDGWTPWDGNLFLDTLYYAEYANSGPGSNLQGRIKWKGYQGGINKNVAQQFTVAQFLRGGTTGADDWLKATGVPYAAGFLKS